MPKSSSSSSSSCSSRSSVSSSSTITTTPSCLHHPSRFHFVGGQLVVWGGNRFQVGVWNWGAGFLCKSFKFSKDSWNHYHFSPTDLRQISSNLPPPIPRLPPPHLDPSPPRQQPPLTRAVTAVRVLLLSVGLDQRLYLRTWMRWRSAAQQHTNPKEN